ncbi:MAG TPA: hypothetical protein VL727_19750 [Puia sp.]|nr:hypothetical protein [Puia sp.]
MKTPTKWKIEGLRGELFHMILFAMAWVMIGEFSLDFKDYAIAAISVLLMVVWLAIYSIKLYDLEDSLPEDNMANRHRSGDIFEKRRGWLFALIFVLEGIAILATWMILLKLQMDHWLVPCFAFIAGLHFLPLARLTRHRSYYLLGLWICAIAVTGYLLTNHNMITMERTNTFVAYGCAYGAVVDGVSVMVRTRKLKRQLQGPELS